MGINAHLMARPKVKIFMTEKRDNEMQRYVIRTFTRLHQPNLKAQIIIYHSGRVQEEHYRNFRNLLSRQQLGFQNGPRQ